MTLMVTWEWLLAAALVGLVVGSFLNVCILRLPAGGSLIHPASHCPYCHTPLRCYHNIPVLSFMLLRGRCAFCRVPIAWRYPLVEAITAALFALVLWRFGWQPATLVYWLFAAALVVISGIDLDHYIIPDCISLPGIVVGFGCSFALPWLDPGDSLLGIALGGGSLWLVAWLYQLLTRQTGMGLGDVKLLAAIGAFMGWQAILPVIFLSSLAGTLVGVPLMLYTRQGRKLALPFGPFIALGALVWLLFGPWLWHWYSHFAL